MWRRSSSGIPQKAASNLRKHGVTFYEAELVFFDPNAIFEQDRVQDGEERWLTIGFSEGLLVLTVVHLTLEEDGAELIRIISARPADYRERSRYEESNGQT
jgi:uncharacterized protein